jgi:2,4-dienoyl-CoA reductase-like NADH-dependent reductase (Old Yellow Enzyme family)
MAQQIKKQGTKIFLQEIHLTCKDTQSYKWNQKASKSSYTNIQQKQVQDNKNKKR